MKVFLGGTFNAPKKDIAENFDFEPTNREKTKRAKNESESEESITQ